LEVVVAWVYAFWLLGSVAVVAVVIDALAVAHGVGGRLPVISLVLKAVVIAGFAAWWAYFTFLATGTTWEDLTSFAGLIVLSIPTLLAATILDVLVVRALVVERRKDADLTR
jgi:hypothetical protein